MDVWLTAVIGDGRQTSREFLQAREICAEEAAPERPSQTVVKRHVASLPPKRSSGRDPLGARDFTVLPVLADGAGGAHSHRSLSSMPAEERQLSPSCRTS
jgi:hypothetical protein